MGLVNLSVCNLNNLNCDTVFIDSNLNRVAFFSAISYSTLMKASMKRLSDEKKPYCYIRGYGTLQMPQKGYELEQKKQPNGEYVHCVGVYKDKIEEIGNVKSLSTYIFYTSIEDRNNKIFNKIYNAFSVPMLEEWKSYICDKLLEDRKIYELSYETAHDPLTFRGMGMFVDDNYIQTKIIEGLRCKEISVNGSNDPSMLMDSIDGLDSYLSVFGETLASKIQESFTPKFIPGTQSYTESVNDYDDSVFTTGIEMYEAQKSTVQAAVNNLIKEDTTFVIGEMGSGI